MRVQALAPNEAAGEAVWLTQLGTGLVPLVRASDWVEARSCDPDALTRGSLVLVRRSGGNLCIQVVLETTPLRLANMGEMPDASAPEVLGLIHALVRDGQLYPLPEPPGGLVSRLQHTMRTWWGAAGAGRQNRPLDRSPYFPGVGPIVVRRLRARDAAVLTWFVREHLTARPEFLTQQLRQRWHTLGAAVGAFDANGRMCGFAYLDEYTEEGFRIDGFWIRMLMVSPSARRLGLGHQMVGMLCREAKLLGLSRVRADIKADNFASRALFRRVGFSECGPDLVSRIRSEWARMGLIDEWVVVEKSLDL